MLLTALKTQVPGIIKSFHYHVCNDGPLNLSVTPSWV